MLPIKKKALTGWMLALMNVAAVSNIKNFPLLAEYGLSIIVFLSLSAFFFFLPVTFISSELASAWPDRGVYTWVKEALGERLGFLAIWLQWISNVIYYPTLLTFIAGTLAYIIDPALATNKAYVVPTVLSSFWLATCINFFGMRVSAWISSIAALLGTLIPIALIILLGGVWIFGKHPSAIEFRWGNIFPDLSSMNQLVLLSGVLLGLAGLEMSSVHARDVKNPQKDYPRGIFLSAFLIIIFSVLGAIAIAAVVPAAQIELASGAMEAFRYLFEAFRMPWATPLIAGVTFIGALGMLSTWIAGPSRGLLATAEHGSLPPIFQRVNRHGVPISILITQALIVTALSFVFVFLPTVNSAYWALVALSSILYQMMYIIMFIAAIRLRYKYPLVERPYKIPFGNTGIWVVGILGMIGSSFGFAFGFFPPSQFGVGKTIFYECLLIGGSSLFCLLPLWVFSLRKAHWKKYE